jgi:glucokinase
VDAPLVIGVDVGGTKILSGVVDRDGTVLSRNLVESPDDSRAEVLKALESSIEALLDERIAAIGLGVPSHLDRRSRKILQATNLPLEDFDLAAHVRERFGLPVGIENDAGAATLAEWRLGAGRGASNLVLLTLGTGVGGGVVLDGALYRGWAEVGHMVVLAGGPPCQGSCHGHGHLEALASGTAADRAARELFGPEADARDLVERAHAGDEGANARLDEIAGYLGAAIGSLANLFDPELVVVGGGFGEAAEEFLLERAQAAARAEALAPADAALRVVSAELGTDAGLIGAALVGYAALEAVDGTS